MFKSFLIAGIAGFFCFSPPSFADDNVLIGFRPYTLPEVEISGVTPMDVIVTFIKLHQSNLSDTPMVITSKPEQSALTVDIAFSEYKDDSVSGENYRLIIQKVGELFLIKQAGIQYICARGSNAGQPQTSFCP